MSSSSPSSAGSATSTSSLAADAPLHLVLGVDHQHVALPIDCVRELLLVPRVVPVPGAPAHLRGVANVRGDVLPLVDLRLRLGRPSRAQENEELIRLLRAREADHHDWLRELEACVREKRSFTKARDPHQCAFGRWYDTYKPDHLALQFIWEEFERPHREIHALADVALGHLDRGHDAQALAVIDEGRRGPLGRMLHVFARAIAAVESMNRELAIVIRHAGRLVAVTVDSADAVETLDEAGTGNVTDLVGQDAAGVIGGVRRRPGGGDVLLVLDVGRLVGELTPLRAAA